jgi:DNA-binding NarL/FixJ family response regulator
MIKLNIYIVEDNLLIAAALKHIVTGLGHSVCGSATNYKRAVYDLKNMKTDLVITDIMLTGKKTGIDLGKFITAQLHIPFIYQSSITADSIIKDALDTKPRAYLAKPVSKTSLSDAISAVFGLSCGKNLSTFCPL